MTAGRRRTAPCYDGTSVSSHRSQATCYPLPAKLCFLIKSIVKERLACIPLFRRPCPVFFSTLLARRVTKESIVCPRVPTSGNRGSRPKQGAIQIYSAILQPESYLLLRLLFAPSPVGIEFFFFPLRTLDKFRIALGPNDFRVKCRHVNQMYIIRYIIFFMHNIF